MEAARETLTPTSNLRTQYMAVLREVRQLQDHFGLSVACDVAANIITLLYSIDIFLSFATVGYQMCIVTISTIFMCYSLLRLLMVAETCAAASSGADEVRSLFAECSLEVPPLHFSAAGFFYVDRSLLVSVISITVTYVIVLYQFHSV
ncbi:uncharacterized protein LOC126095434 [Schistocerca cancellata]|uniref:uncharacterized protein LOC126095434 n=1 Tax=Schistocerca cancellata TaxID=274614 RepID=UPI002117324E|nr:uncharacterized protein LOC126095434 [Schistocerca cancellata]